MALDGASILVTGGCGQIGLAIVKQLHEHHPTAIVAVVDLEKPVPGSPQMVGNTVYHAVDITNEAAVREVFVTVKPIVVFHTAGLIPQIAERLGMNTERHYTAVNVNGTRIVLEAAKTVGTVKAFVFTSSADVIKGHSWQNFVNTDESLPIPTVFDDPYAKSKAHAETYVLSASTAMLPTTALRAHAAFSAYDNNLIPLMLSAPRDIFLGPGKNLYDFSYAPNLGWAHILAAKNLLTVSPAEKSESSSAAGKPFFITNDEPLPFRVFLKMLWVTFDATAGIKSSDAKGFTIPIWVAIVLVWISEKIAGIMRKKPFLTMSNLGDSVAERWFDNSAAKTVLGYAPIYNLTQGITEAAAGYKNTMTEPIK